MAKVKTVLGTVKCPACGAENFGRWPKELKERVCTHCGEEWTIGTE